MANLSDHVVLVTGATPDIGCAVGQRVATDSARVILFGDRKSRLEELPAEIGEHCYIAAFDVSDRTAVGAAFATLSAEFAEITVPVNNAGNALGAAPAQTASLNDLDRMVITNCKGVMYCMHMALPGMIEPGRNTQNLRRQNPPVSARSCTPPSRFQATSMSTTSK